jgi:hypothetical protein
MLYTAIRQAALAFPKHWLSNYYTHFFSGDATILTLICGKFCTKVISLNSYNVGISLIAK